MKTTVNTDVKMPKKVMEALTHFEFYCIGSRKEDTTEDEVRSFLMEHYGQKVADQFKTEFLYQ